MRNFIKKVFLISMILLVATVCQNEITSFNIHIDNWASFDGETIVKQKTKGFIPIKEVNIGDEVQTYKEGKRIWSTVQGWIHRDETAINTFRKVGFKSGQWIGMAPKQNIAFVDQENQKGYKYFFVDDLAIKTKELYISNARIIYNVEYKTNGVYSIMTSQHSYIVFTPKTHTPILTHDFSSIENPQNFQLASKVLLNIGNIFNFGKTTNQNNQNTVAQWALGNLGNLGWLFG